MKRKVKPLTPTAKRKGATTGSASMKNHNARVMTKSTNNAHCTPDNLLELVRQVFGKRGIMLDPCANARSHVKAKVNYTEKENGLAKSWRGHGTVFANPPYGRELMKWAQKVVSEFGGNNKHASDECIMLVPARTDTKWFQEWLLPAADGMCFWKGRLKFLWQKDSCAFPSLILYFGRNTKQFKKVFGPYGWTTTT